ncbi:transmembrane protein 130 [Lepisosteus oculatus]|uniref:transmembrane protein 130 n=1 Tax=Lepisosteus oculatus TaxID=7918 RepID=UPI0035F52977
MDCGQEGRVSRTGDSSARRAGRVELRARSAPRCNSGHPSRNREVLSDWGQCDRMKDALMFVCLSVTVVYLRTDVPEDEASPNGIAAKVLGALRFRQLDGNKTYIRSNGELASDTLTEAAFEISDPLHLLSSASFSYTWDLGDGHVVVSTESYVHHTYSCSGNYTMRLKVEAYWTEREDRHRSPRSGTYSSDLKVLDAVRSVEVTGPPSVEVDQSTLLSLAVNGSPPLTLCWAMVPDCGPAPPVRCHLVRLQGTTLSLRYTFGSAGRYCLRLTARNHVSLLQTFHAFTVGSDATQHVLFILPCATLILITLGFIVFTACRPRRFTHKHRVEEANFDFTARLNKVSPSSAELEISQELAGSTCSASVPLAGKAGRDEEATPLLGNPGGPVVTYLI